MIYYQHKQTGEVIASLNNLREIISGSSFMQVITDVIMPEKVIGNGVICHCMSYVYIRDNYSRINRKKAIELCPDFGQWRHVDDEYNRSVTWLGDLYLHELKPMRKKPFGTPFTEYGKMRTIEYQIKLSTN